MAKRTKPRSSAARPPFGGTLAILGTDIVSFSKLHDDDQLRAIDNLLRWTDQALRYHGIEESEYRWSPAGDGGYLTFAPSGGARAIDAAFSILQKAQRPDWRPRTGEKLQLRLALHHGNVQEARELASSTNIWGMGINTAARILTIANTGQLLVSKQYFDTYIKAQREGDFSFGEVHWRTVKHKHQIEVMNVSWEELGVPNDLDKDRRWRDIDGLWRRTIAEYQYLVHDAMKSGQPIAALAAAKFLLELDEPGAAHELCRMIGQTDAQASNAYPRQTHRLFSLMPPDVLFQILEIATPRLIHANELICKQGDNADSSFFPVSGTVVVEVPGLKPIRIATGEMIGEFNLWIPSIRRTATVRAMEDGMLLSFNNKSFASILGKAPHAAEGIYGLIKSRIVENIINSSRLFPTERTSTGGINETAVFCEKYASGETLDIKTSAYVLLSGRVEIHPPDSRPSVITATGRFGLEPVVGIISALGAPDGNEAKVLDETVAVRIRHEVLRDLQKTESIRRAWGALFGERLSS